MAEVDLKGIHKKYGSVEVLKDINLHIADGEFVVLVGPSGCGKSTLLRCISGLEKFNDGKIFVGGEDATDLEPIERGVGMVFQSYALYPHMTVEENIGFGLKIAKRPAAEIKETVKRVATLLKLDHLLDRHPRALSGGQRQRVAIGRALARQPKIFLFDEPLSNLDAALRVEMRVELSTLHAQLKSTMIYVTHDQVEAMTMADRIVVMDHGRVMQVGAPLELFNHPKNRFVAGFLGQPSTNFVKLHEVTRNGETASFRFGDNSLTVTGVPHGIERASELGLRPDIFSISEGEPDLTIKVDLAEQLGDETLVHAHLETGEKLVAKLKGQVAINRGETVPLSANPEYPMAFAEDGQNLFVD